MWPFCAGHAFNPDGTLLITGGDHSWYDDPDGYPKKTTTAWEYPAEPWAAKFDPAGGPNNYYVPLPDMDDGVNPPHARWYPTNITMPDGSVWVVAGDYWVDTDNDGEMDEDPLEEVPWIRWTGSAWSLVHSDPLGADVATRPLYPYFHVMPSGLFYAGDQHDPEPHSDIYATCDDCTSWFWTWDDVAPFTPGTESRHNRVFNHDHGTCVQLTLEPPYYSWAAGGAHRERVLLAGGGTKNVCYTDTLNVRGPHRGAEIYDLSETARWEAVAPMLYPRKEPSGTMLPDGTVFVAGGHYVGSPCCPGQSCGEVSNVVESPVLPCELFDPSSSTWTEMDAVNFSYGRRYHSFALLLPDGRVLTAGGQQPDLEEGAGQNYEIFYPPYMFKSGPALRLTTERPKIEDAPATIEYGFPFFVEFDQVSNPGNVEACLIAPSAATHANNMTQRRVLLSCEPVTIDSETVLAVTAPWEPEIAPPGYYLLFLLENGVPSEAAWVKLQVGDSVVGNGETETWAGTVHLNKDFKVLAGGTLKVLPGTDIYAWAGRDSSGTGTYTNLAEILIYGQLLAEGTAGSLIRFTSHLGADSTGEWGGITFGSGSGAGSSITYAEVRRAKVGVRLHGVAPALEHIVFSQNAVADIQIEGDVRIPAGTDWRLDAPTRLVALADLPPLYEDSLGTEDLNDLIVLGGLMTENPGAGAAKVTFESSAKDSVNADDWGSITVGAGGTGALYDCDIGFGIRGVYFAEADSATLVDSNVHHYSQEGVLDYRSDALIQICTFDREDVDENVEVTAIHAKLSVPEIRGNTIGWQNVYGIWVEFAKTVCEGSPWDPADTLRVIDNTLAGDGTSDRPGSAGISAEYLCQNLVTLIEDNTVTNWRGRAIDLYETADVHVNCNEFDANFAGAQYTRKNALQESEEDVFWKGNSLRRNASDNLTVVYEKGLQLYDVVGSGAAAGQNTLQRDYGDEDSRNVRIAGGSFEPVVDARHQAWLDVNDSAITDSTTIQGTNEIGPSTGDILVGSPLSADSSCGGGGAAQRSGRGDVADAPHGRPIGPAVIVGLPSHWSLEAAGSNPTSGAVSWVLAAPVSATVRLSVYDVRGRLVRRIGDGPVTPGYHEWQWDRSAEGGGKVAAGVYFLRVESLAFRHTRKVVLLPAGR